MTVSEAIRARRMVRKFRQRPVEHEVLEDLVDLARLAPSGMNLQPLKYRLVEDRGLVHAVAAHVHWAAYLAPAYDPAEEELPAAWVLVLGDTEIRKDGLDNDVGAAVENLLLGAVERGLGCCWLRAIDRDAIRSLLGLAPRYVVHSAVAVGYPAETPKAVPMAGGVRYFVDADGNLAVPKRQLRDVLI